MILSVKMLRILDIFAYILRSVLLFVCKDESHIRRWCIFYILEAKIISKPQKIWNP